ncbi:MAG: hypothetical protein NTX04_09205 [Verrucomicrobia bacterium]|nr:hypothetical protein [Verrucomicrobiota bacterium]
MHFALALLYATATSSLLAVFLAFIHGGLNPLIASTSLAFGALIAIRHLWISRHSPTVSTPPNPWEWMAIASFTLVSARIFLWLVFTDKDSIKVLSPNNLGDLSLHITYIKYLASGVPFWPENPIFTGGSLTYPIGVDLLNSLLLLVGVDLFRSLIWVGLVGAALTGIALWHSGRAFSLFGFLANGGLFAFPIFFTAQLADFQSIFAWKSLALALLATQRGLLFALPAGLLLLTSWRLRWFATTSPPSSPLLSRPGQLLLYFLSFLLACWFLCFPSIRRDLLQFVALALIPASTLVLLVTGHLHGASVLGIKLGWMWDDPPFVDWCRLTFGEPARTFAGALFWPLNFGILPILIALLLLTLWKKKSFDWPSAILFPSLFVFLFCALLKFAPWEWDNTKLIVWSYLAILPVLWSELLAHWSFPARALTCFALFFSGFLSTLGGLDSSPQGYPIASREELDGVASALHSIPPTERFAGAPTYNHPLLLSGRKMALGYLGHVISHGLDWEQPSLNLDALLLGHERWRELSQQLSVRYLFWGRLEDQAYPQSTQPWKGQVQLVASGDWGEIYDLSSPIKKIQPAPPEILP